MTLLEAIQNCGENWFRPIGWKGKAFSNINGLLWIENFGDFKLGLAAIYRAKDLLGDWEIVTPDQVLSERGERG